MAQFVSTAVGKLHATIHGTGPAMMFWPSLFMGADMYGGQLAYFAERFTAVAVDGPGHGSSPRRANGGLSVKACAQAAAQIAESLELGPMVFVGTSWGGLVGARLAAARPDLVTRLVTSGAPFDAPSRLERLGNQAMATGFRLLGGTGLFQQSILASLFSADFLRNEPDVVNATTRSLRTADRAAMAPVVRSVLVHRGSTIEALQRVRCPTLVVAGELDRIVPPAIAQTHSRSFTQGSFEVLPGCGHLAALEGVAAFNQLVDRFLQQHAGAGEPGGEVRARHPRPRLPGLFGTDTTPLVAVTVPTSALVS